ncbi:MAG: hypothetical protein V4585_05035 [Bacteroidota bacterium]
MKIFTKYLILLLSLGVVISCKTKEEVVIPEVLCSPTLNADDYSSEKFNYDVNGKPIGGELNGDIFKFEYAGSNITKMIFPNATTTVEYDAQNRPVKAKKVYASVDFNYTTDFVITYDANNRLNTELATFKGDFEFVLLSRLEYDAKRNVLKQYMKENTNPEFLWIENAGFDDKKNVGKALKWNPLHLFYDPLNLYDTQSENNQATSKARVINSEYLGGLYNVDIKNAYTAYNSNGYPTAGTHDFSYEHADFSDPTSTTTVKNIGTSKLQLDYFCK